MHSAWPASHAASRRYSSRCASAPCSNVLRLRPTRLCIGHGQSLALGMHRGGLAVKTTRLSLVCRNFYPRLIGKVGIAPTTRPVRPPVTAGRWKRENFACCPLALGKVALPIAQESQRLLLMERERVVDLRPDAVLRKPCPQFIPARNADDVLVEDVVGARVGPGRTRP